MRRGVHIRIHSACALLLLGACATASSGQTEKGGLVPVKVSQEQLDRAHASRRLAMVLGISEFDDAEWRNLRYANKDARDVAAMFADPGRGNFNKVLTLTRREDTTRAAVERALAELARLNTQADDTVVLYVSSHGTLARDNHGELKRYLVVKDSRLRDVPGTALSMDELKQRFEQLPSRKKLLVLATCHSGAGKSLLPQDVQKELDGIKAGFFVRPIEEASKASIILSACDWGETAREDERLENDIYTHFFVEALSGDHDRNGDGAVTATEAHDYARRKTYEFTGGRQRASAEAMVVGTDPVALVGTFSKTGAPELFSYASSLDGFTVRMDGDELGELPGGIVAKAGTHRLQISKGGSTPVFDRELGLEAGQRIAVEDLLAQTAPRVALGGRVGVQSFISGQAREQVYGLTPSLGLSLAVRDLPMPRMQLVLDGSLGTIRGNATPVQNAPSVGYRAWSGTVGVAAPYQYRRNLLTVGIGPRVALVYLARSYDASLAQKQDFMTVSPGLVLSGGYALTERWQLNVGAQAHFLFLRMSGQNQGVASVDVFSGLSYKL